MDTRRSPGSAAAAPAVASDSIVGFLKASAARRPAHVAVEDLPDGSITYAALDALSDRVRDRLVALGVRHGDRVGVSLRKTIDAYATILGALKAGAAYVPVDLAAPPWRAAFILHDCSVRVAVLDAAMAAAWRAEAQKLGPLPVVLELTGVGGGAGLR
ncbi:MAG: amino acid adenylation domain-containing protein, partial [Planctomycetes bacterium]|nr:amino acid adenylation domain-containing protein [Planctomycetota bacterium]